MASHPRHARSPDIAPPSWDASKVGVVKGYPRTPETFDARRATLIANSSKARAAGLLSRTGTANGYAGRRKELHAERAAAQIEARAITAAWSGRNAKTPDEMLGATQAEIDEELGNEALTHAVAILRGPYAPTEKLIAARLVADFMKVKPAGHRSVTTIGSALSFLDDIAAGLAALKA